jgi:HSP20 family protein
MARNSLMPFRPGGLIGGDPFLSLHREMNRLFDDALRGSLSGSSDDDQFGQMRGIVNARMNVSETDKEIRITAELPGVSEKDIDVSLDDDVLTIRGEKRMEQKKDENEKENFHFVERSFGSFQRSLRLPYAVDPEQVQARFDNGVLTVTLPKTAQAERSRRIQVQGGAKPGASPDGGSGAEHASGQGAQGGSVGHDGGGKQPGASPGM